MLIVDGGVVKICDLGLCEVVTVSHETVDRRLSDHETFIRDLKGTAQYIAPELITDYRTNRANFEPSFPADVYSFGILFWELLHAPLPTHPLNWNPYRILVESKYNHYRPKIDPMLPIIIQSNLKSCWEVVPSNRPTFNDLIVWYDLIIGTIDDNSIKFPSSNDHQLGTRNREYSHSVLL